MSAPRPATPTPMTAQGVCVQYIDNLLGIIDNTAVDTAINDAVAIRSILQGKKTLRDIITTFTEKGEAKTPVLYNDKSRIEAEVKAHSVTHLSEWERIAFVAAFFQAAQVIAEEALVKGVIKVTSRDSQDRVTAQQFQVDLNSVRLFIAAELYNILGFKPGSRGAPGYAVTDSTVPTLTRLRADIQAGKFNDILRYYTACQEALAYIETAIRPQYARIPNKPKDSPRSNDNIYDIMKWVEKTQDTVPKSLREKVKHYHNLEQMMQHLTNHATDPAQRIVSFLHAFHNWRDKYRATESYAAGRVFTRNLSKDPLYEAMYKLWEKLKPDYKQLTAAPSTQQPKP